MTTTPTHRSPVRGASYVILGAFLFGFNGSMSKVVMAAGISPEQLTFFRVLGTALIAGGVLLATDRTQFRLTRREVGWFAMLGVGGLAMVQWLYSVAISLLPVGVALLFEYTAVVLIALTARVVLKEHVRPRLWWAIGIMLIGLAVVAQVWDSPLSGLGVLAGFGAAVAYAFYFLGGERSVAGRPAMAVAFWAAAFATMFWLIFARWWKLPLAAYSDEVSFGGALETVAAPMWLPLLAIVTLGGFAPFTLIFMSLRHISATASGLLASSEVVFAFVVAWVWLGEALAPIQIVGSTLVLVAIVVAQTARRGRSTAKGGEAFAAGVPPEVP